MIKSKRIVALVLCLIMVCSLSIMLSNCSNNIDELEKENQNLISFSTRTDNSDPGSPMHLTSKNKSMSVEWTCRSGWIMEFGHEMKKNIVANGEQTVYWRNPTHRFIEDKVSVIVRKGQHIVGYAVLQITTEGFNLLTSQEFPRIGMKYQDISEQYIQQKIDQYLKITGEQQLYSLSAAYEEGFITQNDLLSMAYYFNANSALKDGTAYNVDLMGEDYQPVAKSPENLSEKQETIIRQSIVDMLNEDCRSKILELQNIRIAYYGTYGSGVALVVWYSNGMGDITAYPAVVGGHQPIDPMSVADVKFYRYIDLYVSTSFATTNYSLSRDIVFWTGDF